MNQQDHLKISQGHGSSGLDELKELIEITVAHVHKPVKHRILSYIKTSNVLLGYDCERMTLEAKC